MNTSSVCYSTSSLILNRSRRSQIKFHSHNLHLNRSHLLIPCQIKFHSHNLHLNRSHLLIPYHPFSISHPVILIRASSKNDINNSAKKVQNDYPILLPGCDYQHWLILMDFPKDPLPSRVEMIQTYLDTLSSVLGSMEKAKRNMYAFSTTTYTGFQCTVSEEISASFKGLPGVIWVLPDSYIDITNKDYGGDKYVNGEIISSKFHTCLTKNTSSIKS